MGTPYSWHPGSHPVAPDWGYSPALLPDEAFSSWLLRSAMAHGCDPLAFTGSLWPRWRILTIDPDRWVDDVHLAPLVKASGISAVAFQASFLRSAAERIASHPLPVKQIWPWMLALGARNRKRTGGLQYCPACLAEDAKPYFRLQWRFAWHTGCEHHGCSLLDRCEFCDAPLEPHRLDAQDGSVVVCATCKADLRRAHAHPCLPDALSFQRVADHALKVGEGAGLGHVLDTKSWFELADFFISMVRRANRSEEHRSLVALIHEVAGTLPHGIPVISGSGIELLRTHDRQILLGLVWKFMNINEADFLQALLSSGLSRQGLCPKTESAPALIEGLAIHLRDNPVQHGERRLPAKGAPRPRHQVIRMMRVLERKLAMKMR